ncbi:MAG: 30S ribosomal protein S6 [Lachnospiraceae bacterium]|nr:30S ribosomal protein S6 [Lachnospiraceae bacterium]MBR0088145.1 30S ribosomal protein S6 [Lachnospiraceae bacterium]
MNKYELVIVLNGNLEDDARSAAMERVTGYITRFGGTVANIDEWGKRRLAYEIQKMNEAFYYIVTFEAPVDAPAQIEANIRIMEQVLRFLIVKQEA